MATDDRPDAEDASTGDDSSTERSRIDRRQLLRAGVNTGVAATLVWGVGAANYVSSEDLGSITYALARPSPDADGTDLEPRTKDVPIPWQESLRLAFDAQDAIHDLGLSPLISSFVVPGSYDRPEASVSVNATDEGVLEQIEDVTSSVPIDLTVVDEIPPPPEQEADESDAYRVQDLDPERVPGGVVCHSERASGTLTPALFDAEDGSRYFATSNHVYGEQGTKEEEHSGEPLELRSDEDDERHRIGEVVRGYPAADTVQIDPVDEFRPATEIERAEPSTVIGQFTRDGLADLMAREATLEKIGAFSDHTVGEVQGVNAVTCYAGEICKPGQLVWGNEEDLTDGDSGSVNFRADPENPDDYVLVGGINNARTWWPGGDFTWGTAAHHLLEKHGLHF
ncbi:hypothetical protein CHINAEXTREME_02095 [Halobiforma lacisalsi AJ5]|uniref:Uncharacterized protein n=1 Tax=Natronobacterium lacisalsi AJ5 TaxID=358396 RepID=M0LES1_NATLA|nr:hypothetical protein [Halobiforma lacisalsi]APW96636.1 hypothetical protein CHINAEXTREME_02095 [Halobiforma lacisalsi AJ5]EMA32082.1 hypothetical protein C445_12246 [Halobiforma lacisalsi AJ5]